MQKSNKGQKITKGQDGIPSLEGKLQEGRTLTVSSVTMSPGPGRAPGAWQALVTYEHLSSKTYFTNARKQYLNALKMLLNFITLSQS